MSFVIGENVGSYRIISQLGQGGMAAVFKAYHPGLDRYVAIKVMHPAFTTQADSSFAQRFNREARIVARLEHPNIVPVHDFAEHKGLAYLVMRFVEGETLKARLNRAPLAKEQTVQVSQKVGSALSYAHQQGILHRDIKPSNILISGDSEDPDALGQIFLTDFGLARIAEAGESTLSRDMMMGTPQYISPEQAKGVRELDARTDIYSMGVVLFEMVTGRVPFSADTPYSIIHDHIFTPLPLPSSINPELPNQVERVLLKALAKEPADRYPDADAFAGAFADAMLPPSPTVVAPVPAPIPAAEAPVEIPVAAPIEAPIGTLMDEPPAAETLADEIPTTVSAAAGPAAEIPIEDQLLEEAEPSKKKKRKWGWYLVGVAALIFLCLFSLAVLGRIRENRQAQGEEEPPVFLPEEMLPEDPRLAADIRGMEALVDEDWDNPYSHLDLGHLYLEAGAVELAELHMGEAVDISPPDEAIYLDVGQYLVETERPAMAAEVFVRGLEEVPESRELRIRLLEVFWIHQLLETDPKLSEELAHRLVDADPQEPLFHLFLAQILIRQGNMDTARKELDFVLESTPDMAEAHLVNGIWLRKNRQFIQARQEFHLALELGGERDWLRIEVERQLEEVPGD